MEGGSLLPVPQLVEIIMNLETKLVWVMDRGRVDALCGSSGGTTTYYAMTRNSSLNHLCRWLCQGRSFGLRNSSRKQQDLCHGRYRLLFSRPGSRDVMGKNSNQPTNPEQENQNRTICPSIALSLWGSWIRLVPLHREYISEENCIKCAPLRAVSLLSIPWGPCPE